MKKVLFLNAKLGMNLDMDHALSVHDALPQGLVASMRLLLMEETECADVSIRNADFAKSIGEKN